MEPEHARAEGSEGGRALANGSWRSWNAVTRFHLALKVRQSEFDSIKTVFSLCYLECISQVKTISSKGLNTVWHLTLECAIHRATPTAAAPAATLLPPSLGWDRSGTDIRHCALTRSKAEESTCSLAATWCVAAGHSPGSPVRCDIPAFLSDAFWCLSDVSALDPGAMDTAAHPRRSPRRAPEGSGAHHLCSLLTSLAGVENSASRRHMLCFSLFMSIFLAVLA